MPNNLESGLQRGLAGLDFSCFDNQNPMTIKRPQLIVERLKISNKINQLEWPKTLTRQLFVPCFRFHISVECCVFRQACDYLNISIKSAGQYEIQTNLIQLKKSIKNFFKLFINLIFLFGMLTYCFMDQSNRNHLKLK